MSDLKISQLDELFNPYSSDVIPIVHQGITKKTPISTIVKHLSATLYDQNLLMAGTEYQTLSSHWEYAYNSVVTNSAQWAADNGDVNVNTTVKSNSANWESTYNTFKTVSSTFLTSETDSQTLSFNEANKNLSISNGNTVSLSALVDGVVVLADTEVRALTSGWVGGNESYTNLISNSAAYLSSVDLSFLSVSADWNAAYNTVQSNSAVNWNYQGTDLKDLSANWQSAYNTFNAVSSTFLTSETDSQTLSFNESNKNISISNGNTVSLSALVDGAAVDTEVRALTGNWQDTFTVVQSNSAVNWNYQGTDLKDLSANWENTYSTFKSVSSTFLTSETDSQILSLDETNKTLSISNGNTVSLSSFNVGAVIDTEVRALTSNWESVYNTVNSNSATNWNYRGTDLKDLSAGWNGGNSAYTNLVSNSAAYLSSVDLSFLSVSANWDSVYSNVNANSATNIKTAATTVPGTSAITTIVAVSAIPVVQTPGTLYLLM